MNGYDLSDAWFRFSDENPELIDTNVTALFFAAVQRCKEVYFKEKFGLPTGETMERIGIKSPSSYYIAFNKLVDWGFIIPVSTSKNRHTATIISLSTDAKTESLSNRYAIATESLTNRKPIATQLLLEHSIGKTDIKRKDRVKDNSAPEALSESFELFWKLYGKSADKFNARKKWEKLTDSERTAILAHLPGPSGYIAKHPEPKFRKNPMTYLNGRIWEDEGEDVTAEEAGGSLHEKFSKKNSFV